MKYILLLSVFILSTHFAHSQGYKSMFGGNSTQWIIQWGNLGVTALDTYFVEKDTFAYGHNYKRISTHTLLPPYDTLWDALLREDTSTGKVWFRNLQDGRFDSSEKLAFDFSLQVGDTFNLQNFLGIPPDSVEVVDSVYYEAGLKHIRFKYFNPHFKEHMIFIEGIGCNLGGIMYKEYSAYKLAEYLLCSYKDGVKTTYDNLFYSGNCNPPLSIAKNKNEHSNLRIYPNPAIDHLNIKFDRVFHNSIVSIYDYSGRIVLKQTFTDKQQITLQLHNWTPGLYMVRVNLGKSSLKKIIVLQ